MPLKRRIKAGLISCGQCGKRYSNPLTHVCKPKSTARQQQATRPRKPAAGPKPRRVTVARPAGQKRPEHRPCNDPDCARKTCEAYRLGYTEGYEVGFEHGRAEGES